MFVIVPNELSDAIYERIDKQLEKVPSLVDQREDIYHELLAYFNEHGVIPDFTLEKRK